MHSTNPARDCPDEFLESVSFFTRAHLVAVSPVEGGLVKKADVPAEVMHAGGEWWKRVKGPKGGEPLAGEELVGGEKMADPDGRSAFTYLACFPSQLATPVEARSLHSCRADTASCARAVGVFFIFSKLSIRVPGKYRLLFSVRVASRIQALA